MKLVSGKFGKYIIGNWELRPNFLICIYAKQFTTGPGASVGCWPEASHVVLYSRVEEIFYGPSQGLSLQSMLIYKKSAKLNDHSLSKGGGHDRGGGLLDYTDCSEGGGVISISISEFLQNPSH